MRLLTSTRQKQLLFPISLLVVLSAAPLTLCQQTEQDPCQPTKWWRCPSGHVSGHCLPGVKAKRFSCHRSVDFDFCGPANACRPGFEEADCAAMYASGLCRPWWSDWSPFSDCLSSPGSCGVQQRSQRRHCDGLASHANPAAERGSCRDRRVIAKMRRQGQQVAVRATTCPVRLHCQKINGGWSEWSAPSFCSVTCGIGYQELQRICNNPIPSGGGVPCSGFDSKRVNCMNLNPCPLNGAWCAWSHVEQCDTSCGVGVGLRVRQCRCPMEKHGGVRCDGPKTELSICAMEYCPYSEQLLEDERRFMRDSLRATSQEKAFDHMGQSAPVIDGELYLQCGSGMPIRQQLFDRPGRFPDRRYFWTKDNVNVQPSERVQFDSEVLHILKVKASDAGLYQLMVVRAPGQYANTVCFVPVPVLDTTVDLPEDSHFNLTSPLASLVNVTPTLMGAWRIHWSFTPSPLGRRFGGKPSRHMWATNSLKQSLAQAAVAQISSMAPHMEGTYECYVQLMFVRDLNATDPDADPPPPVDDTGDPYGALEGSPRTLVITNTELSEIFLTVRVTLRLVPNPDVMEFLVNFLNDNIRAIFGLMAGACTVALCACACDCVSAWLRWRRQIWLQHLDAEESNLLKRRLVELQTGRTRQDDRDTKKNT